MPMIDPLDPASWPVGADYVPDGKTVLDLADRLRAEARRWSDLAWSLDSALSLRRKAEPATGYRSNPALGDKPWSPLAYDAMVAKAAFAGARAIRRASSGHEI